MSWLFGSRSRAPSEPAPPEPHHSIALKLVLDALDPEARREVLDLGPPVGPNLEFLSALSCRVRIVDFHRSVCAEPVAMREAEVFDALVERLLPFAEEESFDILFAWDVFNYMRPDQIASLMARLAPACRPRALVLALISTHRKIPAAPLRYRILGRETLAYDGPVEPSRPCPRYRQLELERLLPAFSVKGTFLLRNGIQEYLFTLTTSRA